VTQTSDILEAIRTAGIPLNTTQLAEQLPHIPKASISAACSQLRQQGVLIGTVEEGRVAFRVAAGAGPSDTYTVNVDDDTTDGGDDEGVEPARSAEPVVAPPVAAATPAPEKPPTQSFSPAGMKVRPEVEQDEDPRAANSVMEGLLRDPVDRLREARALNLAESRRRANVQAAEAEKKDTPANPELAANLRGPLQGTPIASSNRNDGRLCRELAAAVLAHWPGRIPYDVQRLVNSAATLPL
jgi:hypothetical protein